MRKRTDEREWEKTFLARLPEEAGKEVTAYAKSIEAINPPRIIYHRESIPDDDLYLEMCGIYSPKEPKWHWGASCICTECGNTFTGGWQKGGGAVFLQMEDGNLLEGWTDGEQPESVVYHDEEEIICPCCGAEARMTRKSKISSEQVYRTQVMELTNIGNTTCLLYWLAEYGLDKNGYHWYGMTPRAAVAVPPGGRICRYTHSRQDALAEWQLDGWKPLKSFRDPEEIPFCEGMGDNRRNTKGAYYFSTAGDMAGKTGEKTGIAEYVAAGAYDAASYLKLWECFPNIENLVRSGAVQLAMDITESCIMTNDNNRWAGFDSKRAARIADLKQTKPHRMLGITRPEYRLIAENSWSGEILCLFKEYRAIHSRTTADEFQQYVQNLEEKTVESLKPYWEDGLGKIYTYLQKQFERCDMHNAEQYYIDYRRMLDRVRRESGITTPLSAEQRFPADLIAAHDRVNNEENAIRREKKTRGGTKEQFKTFAAMKKQFAALEWKKDGMCIIIPESPEELVREGETLHHCVGGYASSHCEGQMIFFVRRERRPERSWYTLNEDVRSSTVHRIQLHGYGNEWTKGKALKIPQKVFDFVNSWEKEILAPYLKNKERTAV